MVLILLHKVSVRKWEKSLFSARVGPLITVLIVFYCRQPILKATDPKKACFCVNFWPIALYCLKMYTKATWKVKHFEQCNGVGRKIRTRSMKLATISFKLLYSSTQTHFYCTYYRESLDKVLFKRDFGLFSDWCRSDSSPSSPPQNAPTTLNCACRRSFGGSCILVGDFGECLRSENSKTKKVYF